MGIADSTTLVVTVIDNGPTVVDAFQRGDLANAAAVNAANAQIVGSVVGVFPISLSNVAGVNAIAGFVVAVKVVGDVQNGNGTTLGDAINLVGSGVTIAAGVAVALGVGTVSMPYIAALGVTSAFASALANQMNITLNDLYLRARNFVRRDPLAIDLDGDGIETVGVAAGVLFDHDADAIKTGTGWLKGDDAFVVLDRNGNGTIDSGRELFGVDTIVGTEPLTGRTLYAPDGFAALGSLDGNGDKLFDANDAQYANVRLWRDLNQDGLSQANELQGLAEAGIASIDLATQKANKTLPGGNTQTLTAAVAGLGENAAVSLNLADNPFYREFPDHLDTSAVASLPDMAGSGRVRDLKEAATLSSSLATQLTNLQGGYRSRQQFDTELDTLLDAWAATSTLKTSAQNSVLYKTAAAKVSRGGTPANGAWKVAA